MKKFFILVLATIPLLSMNAQVKYQGEVNLNTYTHVSSYEFETIHGARVEDNLFFGLGLGYMSYQYEKNDGTYTTGYGDASSLFANFKYFHPVNFPIKPFASLSSGFLMGGWYETKRHAFLASIGVGAMWWRLKIQADCSYSPNYHAGNYTAKFGIGFMFGKALKKNA